MGMKVHIVEPNDQYVTMFKNHGWEVVDDLSLADLVQFTGGSDVSPNLYGETHHPRTFSNAERDAREEKVFEMAYKLNIPMAGICRGGQFLNVMCGGTMFQDVDGHGISGTHMVKDVQTNESFPVTSTHHQMMQEGKLGKVLLTANNSNRCEYMDGNEVIGTQLDPWEDVEAVLYEEAMVLCFQPHPEYMSKQSRCQQVYFEFIEKHLL